MRRESNSQVMRHQDSVVETVEMAVAYMAAFREICEEKGHCRVTELAERFGVSQVTVVTMLKRLYNEGIVGSSSSAKQDLLRTDDAFRARRARRRHRMVYQFLLALGADEQTAAIDAEEIQPHVSERTLVRLKEFLED